MSKDKGSKNHKKAPADKTSGKSKAVSAYKSEGKIGQKPIIEGLVPKPEAKSGGNNKS